MYIVHFEAIFWSQLISTLLISALDTSRTLTAAVRSACSVHRQYLHESSPTLKPQMGLYATHVKQLHLRQLPSYCP